MYKIIGYEGNEDPAAPEPYTYGAAVMKTGGWAYNAVTGGREVYEGSALKAVYILPTALYSKQWEGCFVARFRPTLGEEPLWQPLRHQALVSGRRGDLEYAVFQDLAALQAAATMTATLLLELGPKADDEKLKVLLTLDYRHPRVNALWVHRSPNRKRTYNLALAHVGETGKEEFLRCLAELDAPASNT